jgi:hypothetical protein
MKRTILTIILSVLALSACGPATAPCPAGTKPVRCEYGPRSSGPSVTVCAATWGEAFDRAHAALDRDGSAPSRSLVCEPR